MFFLFLALVSGENNVHAQYKTRIEFENLTELRTSNTLLPTFPEGDSTFFRFLNTHILYPEIAKQNEMQGSVIVQFKVMADSTISDIKVLRYIWEVGAKKK